MGLLRLATGIRGPSGFGSGSTSEQVTEGVDASRLTALVTGGSSGIGTETARVLALRGAHVVIAARNMQAANEVKQRIVDEIPSAKIDVIQLELGSLKSVRACAEKFLSMNLPLNLLINNAGIMFCPYTLSEDGIEMQFATNHLGHFLLTDLLLEKMKSTAKSTGIEGRIVNVSSLAHSHTYPEGIRFDKINDTDTYNDKFAYGQSKLANVLHANELARRLQAEGANITVNSLHPGLITTNLMRHSLLLMRVFRFFTYMLWKNIPQGAATTCYVALHPNLRGVTGKYFDDCNEEDTTAQAKDEELARKLWDLSEKMVKANE
ncbi:short-chain dehydrogenase TIC 32 B, chloroplastic-like [Curcuma longa]|uniref:short-chain dehydrogenase TIC 32 B, chloroplastic-like n=1 Tax=Curcuma longa TaxID=136217 RepID=UPI003D9E945A